MSDINRVIAVNVTNTSTTLMDNTTPKLIKTILMGNGLDVEQNLSLMIDNVQFMFTVPASSTLVVDNAVVCSTITGVATSMIGVHITGMDL
ncbi:MAG: hypothetical protein ACI4WU_04725 [Bacilli bacterium]